MRFLLLCAKMLTQSLFQSFPCASSRAFQSVVVSSIEIVALRNRIAHQVCTNKPSSVCGSMFVFQLSLVAVVALQGVFASMSKERLNNNSSSLSKSRVGHQCCSWAIPIFCCTPVTSELPFVALSLSRVCPHSTLTRLPIFSQFI